MAYELSVNLVLGAENAGLTLSAQRIDTAGANVGAAVTTGFVDLTGGDYLWTDAAFPDGFRGAVKFSVSGGDYMASVAINPEEVEGGGDLTAEDVWTYTPRTLTQSAAQVAEAVQGSTLVCLRGDTFVASLTGMGSLVGRDILWFTVKDSRSDTDAQAIIQIIEGTGLVRLNGAAATAADGSLVVDDETAGDVTITLAATATALLRVSKGLDYDIQMADGIVVTTKTEGDFAVPADVSRSTS